MKCLLNTLRHRAAAVAMVGSVVGALCACGGADVPLLASLPQAVSADTPVRTSLGLYALREQAEQLDAELAGQVVWADVYCCQFEEVQKSVDLARALQASARLPDDVPIFVTSASARLAAAAVDALAQAGHSRVFLVVD